MVNYSTSASQNIDRHENRIDEKLQHKNSNSKDLNIALILRDLKTVRALNIDIFLDLNHLFFHQSLNSSFIASVQPTLELLQNNDPKSVKVVSVSFFFSLVSVSLSLPK